MPSLKGKFPDPQGKYREFLVFSSFQASGESKEGLLSRLFRENSLEIGTGNFDRRSGKANFLIRIRSGKRAANSAPRPSTSRARSKLGVLPKGDTRT
jgi:hypothetical protein